MERTVLPPHPGLIGSEAIAPEFIQEDKLKKFRPGFSAAWLVAPSAIWLVLFLVLPLIFIVVISFWNYSLSGMVPGFTLEHYVEYFTSSIYSRTLLTTLRYTFTTMVFCLLLAYPIAYFLALVVKTYKWQMSLFLVCMVPFWTSYLIRAIAWVPMLGRRGLLNNIMIDFGIIEKPATFLLFSEFALTMALMQLYVVLCIGPMFFSLAKIDKAIIEAARDMGASSLQIFRQIILPLSLPGVAIGMIFIFVMIMGEFATAVVVGGGKFSVVGTLINQYAATANYPRAAVNAIFLMIGMMIGVVFIMKLVDIRKQL